MIRHFMAIEKTMHHLNLTLTTILKFWITGFKLNKLSLNAKNKQITFQTFQITETYFFNFLCININMETHLSHVDCFVHATQYLKTYGHNKFLLQMYSLGSPVYFSNSLGYINDKCYFYNLRNYHIRIPIHNN